MNMYEVCMYPFVATETEHTHKDNEHDIAGEIIKRGWTVYVREYETEAEDAMDVDTWNEVFDEDYDDYESAFMAAMDLVAKYDAALDVY